VCPDNLVTRDGSRCEDDVRSDSVTGGIQGSNQQCVRFSRPITTGEIFGYSIRIEAHALTLYHCAHYVGSIFFNILYTGAYFNTLPHSLLIETRAFTSKHSIYVYYTH
jgi:hypothetical protein